MTDEDKDIDKREQREKTDDTLEHVFHFSPPWTQACEWIANCNLKGIIDLTPGDGGRAFEAARARAPYVGLVCNTEFGLDCRSERSLLIWMIF